ncbi:hypothetical protein GIB67_042944, partial [Kingdonia uniflora]
YSTMLAENLQDVPCPHKSTCPDFAEERLSIQDKDVNKDNMDVDHDYDILSGDESEDNERTIEEDEALFTEMERQEELRALQNEMDLPLDELLKCYNMGNVSREGSPQEIPEPSPVMDQIRDVLWFIEVLEMINCIHVGKESHPSRSSERSCDDHSEHQSNGDISILDNGFLAVETNPTKNQLEDSKISKKQHVLDFRDEQGLKGSRRVLKRRKNLMRMLSLWLNHSSFGGVRRLKISDEDNDYIAAAGEEKVHMTLKFILLVLSPTFSS